MSEQFYSIGDVAKLMGIQSQLLRYYCDEGLVIPNHINPNNGYRYFTYEQFPDIDRVRFLLRCGLTIKEIKSVLENGDIDLLIQLLRKTKERKETELKTIRNSIRIIDWYIGYFSYHNKNNPDVPYQIKHFEKRFYLAAQCPENYHPKDFYNLYNRIRYQPQYKNLELFRQITVIMDYDSLLNKTFKRQYVGKFLADPPAEQMEHILEVPAGDYFCFWASIHNDDWDPDQIRIPLEKMGKPKLVMAQEYENSFSEYNNNPHELQILF